MNRNDVQELFYKIRDVIVWQDMSVRARETLRDILMDLQDHLALSEYTGPDKENN
jgi:hypothetical protein